MSNKTTIRDLLDRHLETSFECGVESRYLNIIDQLSLESEQLSRLYDCHDVLTQIQLETIDSPDKSTEPAIAYAIESFLLPSEIDTLHLSQESLSGTLSKIADFIKRLISSLMSGFKKLLHFIIDDSAQMKFAIEDARIKVNAVEGRNFTKQTVRLGRLAVQLESSLGVPEDYRQLMRGVVELQHQLELIEHLWVKPILNNVDGLNAPLTQALQNTLQVHDLAALNAKTLSILNPDRLAASFTRVNTITDTNYENGTARMGPPLMGNRNIVIYSPKNISSVADAVDKAELIQTISAKLTRVGSIDTLDVQDIEMTVLSPTELLELLRTMDELLNYLSNSSIKDMIARIDRIRAYVENRASATLTVDRTQRESRAALSYGAAYVRWLKDPYIPLIGLTDTTLRALLMLCNRHINAYR